MAQNEKWSRPADRNDTAGKFDPRVHSLTGITAVSLSGFPRPIEGMVMQSIEEQSDTFPFNLDFNDGSMLGLSEFISSSFLPRQCRLIVARLATKYHR